MCTMVANIYFWYCRCILEKQNLGYSSSKPHMDEAYEPIEGKEKSFFSVYVFLNDDYEGGQSSFLKQWQPSAQDVQVRPTQGVYYKSIFILNFFLQYS